MSAPLVLRPCSLSPVCSQWTRGQEVDKQGQEPSLVCRLVGETGQLDVSYRFSYPPQPRHYQMTPVPGTHARRVTLFSSGRRRVAVTPLQLTSLPRRHSAASHIERQHKRLAPRSLLARAAPEGWPRPGKRGRVLSDTSESELAMPQPRATRLSWPLTLHGPVAGSFLKAGSPCVGGRPRIRCAAGVAQRQAPGTWQSPASPCRAGGGASGSVDEPGVAARVPRWCSLLC